MLSFYTYDVYERFVQTGEYHRDDPWYENLDPLPDNFVYYEDISTLGSFVSLVIMDMYHYSCCLYGIHDGYYEFGVYVYLEPQEDLQITEISSVNLDDLRTTDNSLKSCRYIDGMFEYTYVQGKLHSISWTAGGIEYVVSAGGQNSPNTFGDYPLDADTALAKLLNPDSAVEVAAEIVEELTIR
jgi:hypothetical protein